MTKTIAEQLACEVKELTFHELPPEVIHQVKRLVLDTLGVGFAGYLSEPSKIIQSLIKELKGPAESTVFGSGLKTSCLYSTLANGVMVRYFDYMDRGNMTKEAVDTHGHPSESISPILAVGERQHSTGQEVITAIVSAYELLNRFSDAMGGVPALIKLGWKHEIRAPYIIALVAGRLLGLNEKQMANALAIAGCYNLELDILDVGEEEITTARNLRFPYGAYSGIFAALLAQKGLNGPLRIFEGYHGFADVVLKGKIDFEKLTQRSRDWSILYTWIKNFPSNGRTHGHIEATLTLVKEHDIKPEDVAEVRITGCPRTCEHTGNPAHKYPKDVETAGHSSYYLTAIAILDRVVRLDQFSDEKFRDPRVRELTDKVFMESDPQLGKFASAGISEIITKKGPKYRCQVLQPKGHPMNPMTDADVEQKFRSMAGKFMSEKQMSEVITTIMYKLDKLEDIGELVKLLVIPGQIS